MGTTPTVAVRLSSNFISGPHSETPGGWLTGAAGAGVLWTGRLGLPEGALTHMGGPIVIAWEREGRILEERRWAVWGPQSSMAGPGRNRAEQETGRRARGRWAGYSLLS